MYIREVVTKNRKTKNCYVSHRLVESVQTDKGPRQRVILHLGTLSLSKEEWPKLARALEARIAGQPSLFEGEKHIVKAANEAMQHYSFIQTQRVDEAKRLEQRELVTVDLNSIGTSESRSLGPELVAHTMWKRLGFDEILTSCGLTPFQCSLAQAVIIGRLVQPGSDYATWQWLLSQTALLEMLPESLAGLGKDPVYEIADVLLSNKDSLEKYLRKQEMTLFPSDSTLFLFDLTNTYFEGQCIGNTKAKFGRSKEKRSDCPLVTLALVVDARGFPVYSQVYDGNQSEPQTLEDILNQLDKQQILFPECRPTIVMDRGIATTDNITLLKDRQFNYLVVERRPVSKEYIQEFETAQDTFEKVSGDQTDDTNPAVYVKKVPFDTGSRVLCLSEGRKQKETGMDTLQAQRFLEDVERLRRSVEKRNILLLDKVSQRVGRLKERYSSIAQYYDITLDLDPEGKKVTGIQCRKQPTKETRDVLTGCYVIETSHQDLSAQETWRLYMMLSQVEAAFRALKTDLGFRPVHHQLANRTEAHLFVSVLAYHLLVSIEYQLRKKNDHRRWSSIRTALSTHQRNTVLLTDAEQQIHSIRVSGIPETAHRDIYDKLGVKDSLRRLHDVIGKRL